MANIDCDEILPDIGRRNAIRGAQFPDEALEVLQHYNEGDQQFEDEEFYDINLEGEEWPVHLFDIAAIVPGSENAIAALGREWRDGFPGAHLGYRRIDLAAMCGNLNNVVAIVQLGRPEEQPTPLTYCLALESENWELAAYLQPGPAFLENYVIRHMVGRRGDFEEVAGDFPGLLRRRLARYGWNVPE